MAETNNALHNLPLHGKRVLQKIHYWKTQNQQNVTDKYTQGLNRNFKLIPKLESLLPVTKPTCNFIRDLIEVLKLPYANLPVASAQASFLCNRAVPILDRFVAQFFSRTVSQEILGFTDYDMRAVFRDIEPVRFLVEDDGTHKCKPRLAVYQPQNYERNRDVFVFELLPMLDRISKSLNDQKITYQDINGQLKPFTSVDVEMAVFAFGTQNRHYFQCWYEEQPTCLNL